MLKRIMSTALCAAFLLANGIPAYAASINQVEERKTITISEAETILEQKEMSDIELHEAGYSSQQITEIKEINLEEAFIERAQLPKETLRSYGYTDEQIEILKEYDGSKITAQSAVLAASSSVSASFYKDTSKSYSSTSIPICVDWAWSIVPLFKTTDEVVLCWEAVNSSNVYIDASAGSKSAILHYYKMTTGTFYKNVTKTCTESSVEEAVYCGIPMTINDNYYWVKSGTMKATITCSSAMKYVDVGFAYGHATVTGNISFSIGESLSVSFTPELTTNRESNITGRVTNAGIVTNYGEI